MAIKLSDIKNKDSITIVINEREKREILITEDIRSILHSLLKYFDKNKNQKLEENEQIAFYKKALQQQCLESVIPYINKRKFKKAQLSQLLRILEQEQNKLFGKTSEKTLETSGIGSSLGGTFQEKGRMSNAMNTAAAGVTKGAPKGNARPKPAKKGAKDGGVDKGSKPKNPEKDVDARISESRRRLSEAVNRKNLSLNQKLGLIDQEIQAIYTEKVEPLISEAVNARQFILNSAEDVEAALKMIDVLEEKEKIMEENLKKTRLICRSLQKLYIDAREKLISQGLLSFTEKEKLIDDMIFRAVPKKVKSITVDVFRKLPVELVRGLRDSGVLIICNEALKEGEDKCVYVRDANLINFIEFKNVDRDFVYKIVGLHEVFHAIENNKNIFNKIQPIYDEICKLIDEIDNDEGSYADIERKFIKVMMKGNRCYKKDTPSKFYEETIGDLFACFYVGKIVKPDGTVVSMTKGFEACAPKTFEKFKRMHEKIVKK